MSTSPNLRSIYYYNNYDNNTGTVSADLGVSSPNANVVINFIGNYINVGERFTSNAGNGTYLGYYNNAGDTELLVKFDTSNLFSLLGANNPGAPFKVAEAYYNPNVPAPTYSISVAADTGPSGVTASGAEGTTAGTGTVFTYTVTRTGNPADAGAINLAFGGTATGPGNAGADYTIASGMGTNGGTFASTGTGTGSLTFQANQASATFTLTSTPDSIVESDETATVTLLDGSGSTSATATILDDDAQTYTIALNPAQGAEGTAGSGAGTIFTYTVTRSGNATAAGSVNLAFSGTATPPGGAVPDYAISSGTGTYASTGTGTGTFAFTAGQASATFTVTTALDATIETDEGVTVTLASVASGGGAIGTTNAATATILNDDTSYAIGVSPTAVNEGTAAGSGGTLTYTVTRTGDLSQASTVAVGFTGSATQGSDYAVASNPAANAGTYSNGTLTFVAGQATASFLVNTTPDADFEPDESITASISGPSQGGTVTTASATGTITNDDAAPSNPPPPAGPTPGDDNLTGTAGSDTISLLAGNDTFTGGAGADLVYGNQGNDLIYGNQDADTLYGGQGDDQAYGGQGDDRLYGNQGNDVLFGNAGADIVYGNQGNDIVYGNQGADILFGGQGNDVLYGGQGDDTLVGGTGDDTLAGGLGADRYVFDANSGRDLILGFNQGEGDRIALGGQTYTVSSAPNGDALLTLSGGGVVDLAGIRAEQVNATFFA